MKFIKITATFACCFLIALFILIIIVENPEVALYDKTVEVLMNQEKLETEEEVLDYFPALKGIKSNMTRVAYLNYIIQDKTQGPAPMITEEESKQLMKYTEEVQLLRRFIRQELTQLIMVAQQIKTP
ncbi:MAG: hypothetical protein AB8F94_10085 [Saprospiraceae bacterium]